jgi:urease accessory protein UreH
VERDALGTRLAVVRHEGLLRASRGFREGDAVRVVVATLGPGYVRGDAFAISGRVGERAHLIVGAQSASRALAGTPASSWVAEWSVGEAATLELRNEPLVVFEDAVHETRTEVRLERAARLTLIDLAVLTGGRRCTLTSTTRIVSGAGLVLADRSVFGATVDPQQAVGTLISVREGDPGEDLREILRRDAIALRTGGLAIGVGSTPAGATVVRIVGDEPWTVRAALLQLREAIAPSP